MLLNEQQQKAVEHRDGPCLVVSVPGSGKTAMLVERTSHLIANGADPTKILCITFTNKAAKEMKERICTKLNTKNAPFFVGTFHALCAMILRKAGNRIGYKPSMSIIDADEQEDLVKKILRSYASLEEDNDGEVDAEDIKKEKTDIKKIIFNLNDARENCETVAEMQARFEDKFPSLPIAWKVAQDYLIELVKQNVIDFSGILSETYRLLSEHKDILVRLQNRFDYIQIDETQDTNLVQFKIIKLLGGAKRNIMLVGDLSQCVVEDTLIETPSGQKKVQDLLVGDKIIAASGGGNIRESVVDRVYTKQLIEGKLIKIKTKMGKELVCTSDHLIPAAYSEKPCTNLHFVYLMYKETVGYRIGITRHYENRKQHTHLGFKFRLQGERADKLWILKACKDSEEAKYYEQLLSVTYGIPTWCFIKPSGGCKLKPNVSQNSIDRLYNSVDSLSAASKLLTDFCYNIEYPHICKSSFNKKDRAIFNIIQGDDGRYAGLHSCFISVSSDNDYDKLKNLGVVLTKSSRSRGYHKEFTSSDLKVFSEIYEKIKNHVNFSVMEYAKFSNICLPLIPASQILKGMQVFIKNEDKTELDSVISIEKIVSSNTVYDLDISRYHNFIANGIVVRNSIYAFRGARYQNILDFLKEYPDCVQIPLTLNYRSTPEVIAVADKLIRHNKSHMKVKFETDNPSGQPVEVVQHTGSQEEAQWLAHEIKEEVKAGRSLSDIAVFYRLNKLSMELQIELAKEGIPFLVVGGPSFFARSEIKDVLTALRYVVNHEDTLAFHRIAGLFRGIGDATIGTIEAIANKYHVTTFDACKNIETYRDSIKNDYMQIKAQYDSKKMMGETVDELEAAIKVTPKVVAAAKTMHKAFSFDYSKMHAGDALVQVVANLEYDGYLDRKYGADAFDRKENVTQLINNATEYGEKKSRSIERYIQNVALSSSSDKDSEVKKVTLMTLHACKGLEFPRVFMVGVEHNILPHGRALMDAENPLEALEEERRICYVGFTRAKEKLTASYCLGRRERTPKGFMERKASWPSQFLKEAGLISEKEILGAHNVDVDDANGRRHARRAIRDAEFPDDRMDRFVERDIHA